MADSTVNLKDNYKPGPGPYIEGIEVDDPVAAPCPVFTLASLSSGKAIPAAADSIRNAVVIRSYTKDDGLTYVDLDGSGAIIKLDTAGGALDVPTDVSLDDNQTAESEADPTKMAGCVVGNTEARCINVQLRKFSAAPYAS